MNAIVMPSIQYKPSDATSTEGIPPALDPRRALLARILASSTFAKSERLSSLLMYICSLTFLGQEKSLSEQKIGEAVFDRPLDYDSAVDGIVRTQASRLRKRLDLYFDGEGADEPIRIVIPRGGYVPLFEPRGLSQIALTSPELPPIEAPVVSTPEPSVGAVRRSLSAALAWSLVVILGTGILAMLLHERSAPRPVEASAVPSHSLSQLFFSAGKPTLIVPSDCGLVITESSLKRDVGLSEYLRGDYLEANSKAATTPEKLARDLRRRRYTSIVDLEVVESLSEIALLEKNKVEVRFARDVRPNDIKQGNVVLLGAAEGNPWVELYEHNMNFAISKNWKNGVFSVFNRSPQGKEARQWESSYDDPLHRVYGIVAYLPNLSGAGNVLLLEGTSMAGTECAWDFAADDSQLGPFLNRIRRPDGTLPHFEVLLETSNISGSALKGSILASRVVR